jgi:hypothetical protein
MEFSLSISTDELREHVRVLTAEVISVHLAYFCFPTASEPSGAWRGGSVIAIELGLNELLLNYSC